MCVCVCVCLCVGGDLRNRRYEINPSTVSGKWEKSVLQKYGRWEKMAIEAYQYLVKSMKREKLMDYKTTAAMVQC